MAYLPRVLSEPHRSEVFMSKPCLCLADLRRANQLGSNHICKSEQFEPRYDHRREQMHCSCFFSESSFTFSRVSRHQLPGYRSQKEENALPVQEFILRNCKFKGLIQCIANAPIVPSKSLFSGQFSFCTANVPVILIWCIENGGIISLFIHLGTLPNRRC